MRSTKSELVATDFPPIARSQLDTLQVNLGYTCNMSCSHCHVNAGPHRREQMDLATVEQVLAYMGRHPVATLDLTGGAPEINPHFRYLVQEAGKLGVEVIDRCNLTILLEPGFEWLAAFLAEHQVTVVASLPCYSEQNVAEQRGRGVFEKSIAALKTLNTLGYGRGGLTLNLVYNPNGAFLPPPQQQLEADYRRALAAQHGIVFDHLFTLTNMPVSRFGAVLLAQGQFHDYMSLLRSNFSPGNLPTLMCRSTLSVDWRGYLYDCDFNQMLDLAMADAGNQLHIRDLDEAQLRDRAIVTGDHCYGCAAGQGSSCGGALEH